MTKATLPTSPRELLSLLGSIYPDFVADAQRDSASEFQAEPISFHGLMSEFAAFFGRHADSSSDRQLQRLCEFVVRAVAHGGVIENAVSTCFLEHTRQIKVNRALGPGLAKARSRLGASRSG
jgi:hypothetical protein